MKLTKNDWFNTGDGMAKVARVVVVLGLCLLGMLTCNLSSAQGVSTTTVQGTVYLANGQVAAGTLVLSWPAFTTASGQSVAADSLTVTVPPDGFISVNLAPNAGATPAGLYYTAVYYLSDGTTTTQYWVVPAAAEASLAQVQAQLMPAAQAVQAVSKSYVDEEVSEAIGSLLTASGGTLSGPLYLNGDPTQPLQAADKHYVDEQFSLALPLAGGNMTGGLQTPAVNGVESPAAASAQTTLQQAVTAAGPHGAMEIPPTYTGTDTFTNANGVYVSDLRTGGAQQTTRSVKEFGAVCDGVTDDTNALQSALNYANAHAVALTIPQGTCKTRQLNWHGESIGGLGKQVSALMGYPGQDVLASATDSLNMLSYTRLHDLTIYVDQSVDASCSPAEGRASAGTCAVGRPMEKNTIFSPGGNGLTGAVGSGAGWSVGNCAIAMPAATGAGGNGLRVAEVENVEIATTGADPLAAAYAGAHSTHTCGLYLAQWPQWSEFRNLDIRGLNTGIAIPPLPGATPAGLNSDSNRWQNVTISATHAFTASAGSNNVLDNVVAVAGNSSAAAEPPTGLVLDLSSLQAGWTVRNAVVLPSWYAVQPQLTVTATGGAVTAVTVGPEHGLGFDPYGTQVPIAFSGSCTAAATASVNSDGSIGSVSLTFAGVGCSGTTTASINVAGTWDTAAPVNLIGGQGMTFFAGNLLKGNGGYTVWNAGNSQSSGTALDGGGGNLPGGGTYAALVASSSMGSALAVDQFPGADIGAKLQACLGVLSGTFGGTCDARNFTGSLTMASNLTISKANTTVLLPCATIATANQLIVAAGTRNVSLRGCAMLGGSASSGSQGGTAFLYSGSASLVQVGDPTYAVDTPGFHMDNVVINTTAATSATAQGLAAYRTQEMNLENLYFLGNSNQTGMTLDGTGNYTGGSFFSNHFSGFQTAVNGIGHQITNPATTDWMNASTFVRLHVDCPTSSGSPIAGTYGINLQQGDGNTFTGGDVEGCNTALHLGANAQNNTIVGLRNENSNNQVVADTGSSYNNWMSGGTIFTGELTDNGTHNSFQDAFHRGINALNGDLWRSQADNTVTNHMYTGIGLGHVRGRQDEWITDVPGSAGNYQNAWLWGPGDGGTGLQTWVLQDMLNNVPRLGVQQYTTAGSNPQSYLNAAGSGSVCFNCSSNSGTGGVAFGSGGSSPTTVATVDNAGDESLYGYLRFFASAAEVWRLNCASSSACNIDSWASGSPAHHLRMYNGSGTDVDSESTSAVTINNSSASGTGGFLVYAGGTNASTLGFGVTFSGTTAVYHLPSLAASSGYNCLQVNASGYVTNTGSPCGTGTGGSGSGTVNSGTAGQIAYYATGGTAVGGENQVPITAGGTGAATASAALTNLGAQSAIPGLSSDGANGLAVTGTVTAANVTAYGTVEGAKIGSVFQCDQFSGADVSIRANACNSAAVSAGGGVIDLRALLGGNTTGSEEIEIDTPAGSNSLIGVTALLPTTGTYTTTMVGGPATSATVYPNAGGSGYVTGDLVYPVETGFAYTGAAAGAVFSVTATSGAVTGLTLVSGGGGYLTSKYVTTTTNHSGTGLVMNLAAADCGIRLNGRGAILGGSVGAGAASFQIVPANGHSSFVMDSALCTDQTGGYERQEGGLKASNPTGSPAFVSGAAHIRGVVDSSTFNLLETTSAYDDGALIDGACCGANFLSLHADAGNLGGYPVMIGPGGVLKNACTTNGSATITVPYGHLTAKYLGDTVSAGNAGGVTNLPGGTTIVTAINSLTSMTVSQAATATSGGQAACTTPSLTGGSGLTYHLSDPTAAAITAISIHNMVANSPGPGLQNVVVTGQAGGVNFYNTYLESNSAIDTITSQAYIGYPAAQVNFSGLDAPGPASGGSKYGVESDTPFGWCVFGGLANAGLLDQGAMISASNNGNLTYCKGGFSNVANGANLLPDTDFKQGGTYWTLPSGVSIAAGAGAEGDNALSFALSGTASGTINIPVAAAIPNLQANRTYMIGANISAVNLTGGSISVELCTTATCTSNYGKAVVSAASSGVVSASFSESSYTGPYFVIVLNGVTGSGTVSISEPFLVEGVVPVYTENDLGFGSSSNSGAAFSSITLNGGTPWTGSSSANSQVVTCATGGSGTQVCDAAGNWVAGTMNYPGSGVPNSTGSAWGTSYTVGTSGPDLTLANGANTWSAANVFSAAGAASTPSVLFSGTPYTAGTATTNYPMVSLWPGGATSPSTWSTAGTMLGVNTASGFTGNLIDAHVNGGSSVFAVNYLGTLTSARNILTGATYGFLPGGLTNSGLFSSASGLDELGSTDATGSSVARLVLDMVGGGVAVTPVAGTAAGTSPTISCASSHVCSAMNGTVSVTTGTSPTTGALLTITDATAHTNYPDCTANIALASSPYTAIPNYQFSYSTTVWTLNVGTALSASTAYTVTYHCQGY